MKILIVGGGDALLSSLTEEPRHSARFRSQASKANGGARYEFTEADVPKLRKIVDEYERRVNIKFAGRKKPAGPYRQVLL